MNESTTIRWERDQDGVVVLTLDAPGQSANTMNSAYVSSMEATVERLEAERAELAGVILTSAKQTFFAGGDLYDLRAVTRDDAAEFTDFVRGVKHQLRRLERLGKPVVAAINGTALGGGLELALATHHRIVVGDPSIRLGLPEVTLGLLPGGGGIVRTVRMLGVTTALSKLLVEGGSLEPYEAARLGLVDQIVGSAEDLVPAAKAWIASKVDQEMIQPWEASGYQIPGGTPWSPAFAATLPALPANLRKRLKGANYPAPVAILSAAVEGALVDVDAAMEIETRYFVDLAVGAVAKNMIQAFFFDAQRVRGDRGRPGSIETWRPGRAVVLGAGMMGAAIAYVCARAGIEVVLKDVSLEAAERGKSYSEKLVARGRGDAALLDRIRPSDRAADAAGAELLIEAVVEDPAVKAEVLSEIEPHLADGALLASNTSSLPITQLAAGTSDPSRFIGLHFFSPVDRMPLLEIVKGEQTAEATLYRALDLARQIRKTPILVNDSRGFFTSRVIVTFIYEALAMLTEGVPPTTIEQASSQAGYPTPVLQLCDEVNMQLMASVREAAKLAAGESWVDHPAFEVIDSMVAAGRPGRAAGAGFYEYADGRRRGLWSGLREAFPPVADPSAMSVRELEERMLFAESLETVRCLDEGVVESVADANIGSIMGIGFPGWTGGVLQYINGYAGGPGGFVARARALAEAHGERFEPPASLVERAERGENFSDVPTVGAAR